MTPEERNIAMLAGRISVPSTAQRNPDVALAAMCVLPFLDRIATALESVVVTLENIETQLRN